jgi:hypothetical protein
MTNTYGLGEYGEMDILFVDSTYSNEKPYISKKYNEPSHYENSKNQQKKLEAPSVSIASNNNNFLVKYEINEVYKILPQYKPKLKTNSKSYKGKILDEYQLKKARMHSRRSRAKQKAKLLESIEYSKSLQKTNEKLKQQIFILKEQIIKMLKLYRKKHYM